MKYSDSLKRASTRRGGIRAETWADERFAEQRDRDLADHTIDAAKMLRALGVCAVLALLLSSGRLVDMAEARPFGPSRDALLTTAEGIDRVANFFSLNRPADAISSLRGGTDPGRAGDNIEQLASQFDLERDAVVPPVSSTVAPAAPTSTVPESSPSTTVLAAPGPTSTTTSVPVAEPTRRVLTTDDPLRTLVVGDSQAEIVGQSMIETARENGRYLEVSVEAEVATGLARPDDFNWPAQLLQLQADRDPELVVLMMGGNDDWDMEVAGERLAQDTDAWIDEYRFRVSLMTDIATSSGAHAVWILYPPIRDGSRNETIEATNEAIVAAIEGRDDATVFDANRLFSDDAGGFEVFFENDLGATRRMRADDGVHFTRSGSNWLSRELYEVLRTIWQIPPS